MAGRKHRSAWKAGILLGPLAFLVGSVLVVGDEPSREWEAKAAERCAQAERLLRDGKAKEAREQLAPLVSSEELARSEHRARVLVDHGFASFLLKDYLAAGKSLGQLAPFDDTRYGSYARYLLGGVHQREDERAESAALYEAVIAEHDAARKRAAESLQQADKLMPEKKTRLETLVNGPPPEHVARADFYLGLLYYEGGRFLEAQARFADFIGRHPDSPFASDARFYLGCCSVHLRQFAEAIETFGSVAGKEPRLTGPALLWLGKALAASADAADEDAYLPTLKRAIDTLRRAVDKCAKDRRGEAMLELADVLLAGEQTDEAAAMYDRIHREKLLPQRAEEVFARRITASTMRGKPSDVEKLATAFEKRYPHSPLMAEVLFRRADVLLRQERSDDRKATEAARIFHQISESYPESIHANRARLGLAWIHHQRGELDKARDVLETIPQAERTGDLASVSYLLADCLIRLAPTKADDALAAGKLQEQIGTAATLLGDFVAEHPDSELAPEALLRMGLCQERLAAVMSNPEERNKLFAAARTSYERALLEYPLHERGPVAVFARARCLNKADDANEAIKRLQAFATGALKNDPIAPLALLHLAELIGAQENKAADAARILTQCRKRHGQQLRTDTRRAAWLPLIQYRHALALMDAGQHEEARAVLDELRRTQPERPEAAEAALCWGQALRDGGAQLIERANQVRGNESLPPADRQRAAKEVERGERMVREALEFFESQAEQWKGKEQARDIRARFLYQAIWMYRDKANDELNAARNKLQDERREKRQQELAKITPEGEPVPNVPPPDLAPAEVPLQPAEKKTRALYQTLVEQFPDLPLALTARLELGELLSERGEHEAACKLFAEALDKEPAQDLADRLRLRLAASLMARGDWKAAGAQFDILTRAPDNPFAGQAHHRAAECLLRLDDMEGASMRLLIFRDQEAFQNQGGATDPGLARLGQLFARKGQWEESRQAFAQLISRFPDSPWAPVARLGLGWAWQLQKEFDKALEVYKQIPLDPPNEWAARARVLIGICQLERNEAAEALVSLLAVPANHDLPDLCAFALVEAAHAASKLQQPDQVEKLLRRVVLAYPKSPWAKGAEERLKKSADTPPHESPAAMALLAPNSKALPSLEFLGQQQEVRASLGEAVEALADGWILLRLPQPFAKPAPFVRQTLPNPFEHRGLIPLRIGQVDECPPSW
jgi:TolA-binding protein